ncbi:hypothetical protein [Treponema zioleckii]|uniref:hypothetical protein n=1 Tax=Treponema zioleckii TaxID=331680 RepID=UPI00168AD7CE|nr:hypothetical protein [Treponema zioleckii]
MKKKLIALLLLTFVMSPVFVEDFGVIKTEEIGTRAIFRLPYRNVKGRYRYFNEKVKSALIIDDIMVAGASVSPVSDNAVYFVLTAEYDTEWVHLKEQFAYLSMIWRKDKNKN